MSTLRGELLELLIEPGVAPEELQSRVLEVLQPADRPRRMTYEEFLAWADEDTCAEWVNGEVIMHSPASYRHQDILRYLTAVLSAFVESHDLGIILPAPFQMRLAYSGREPDLLFLANEHLERRKGTYLDGPADLVIEIMSVESAGRDRGEKFYEYEEAGVPEYWLIDPLREEAEFYRLDDRGRYRLAGPDAEGVYRSRMLPGFWLRVAWLWQPPAVLDALRELRLV
jgi:Uma2 family endonuclease